MKNSRILMCLILFGMVLAIPLMAQTTSAVVGQNPYSVSGFVFDSDGDKAVGCVITLTVEETGEELTETTNANGSFAIELLNLQEAYSDGDTLVLEFEYSRYPDADNETAILVTTIDVDQPGEVVEVTTSPDVVAPSLLENLYFQIFLVVLAVVVIALIVMAVRS